THNRYTPVAIILHWVIAAAILFQLALGWRMGDLPKGPGAFALFQLHKSIGFLILFLVAARVAWRLTHRPPPLPAAMASWEKVLSKLVHLAFYGIMIALPVTGWIAVSTSRIQIPTLWFGAVPVPHLPFLADLAPAVKEVWNDGSKEFHEILAALTLLLLAAHVGGLLKHQLLVKDTVLAHMAPGARPGWAEPRLWIILAVAAGMMVAGFIWPKLPEPAGGSPLRGEPAPLPVVEAVQPVPETAPAVATVADVKPAAADPVTPPVTANAAPLIWKVQSGSVLEFGTSWSGDPVSGSFSRWTADIAFSPDALASSSVTVKVDLTSVSSGDAQRDSALPGEDWFDAGHFPQAVFKAVKFRETGKQRYAAQGTLTLRGKTSPVTLDFRLSERNGLTVAEGSTTLDRTVFGVGQGEYAATDSIPAAVSVNFKVLAKKA
ncbi:MAG TPA: YceI family protein, partial [Fluviicoccus sp.]|nr:YceI family protein [Fluviicoccus sp.]